MPGLQPHRTPACGLSVGTGGMGGPLHLGYLNPAMVVLCFPFSPSAFLRNWGFKGLPQPGEVSAGTPQPSLQPKPNGGLGRWALLGRINRIPHGEMSPVHQRALGAPNPRFLPPGPEAANNNVGLQQTWSRCPPGPWDLERAAAALPM